MATDQLELLPALPPEGFMGDLPLDALVLGVGPEPDAALRQSVARLGVLCPIIATGEGTGWRVLDGRRRVLCARLAEHTTIHAYILPTGVVHPGIVQLASHALRSRNRAAEVDAVEQLFKEGAGERDIAQATGLTVGEVRALLPLTDLSPTFRQALRDGKLAESVAKEIVRAAPAAQRRLEDTFIDKGRVSASDVRVERQARSQQAVQALDLGDLAAAVPDLGEEPPGEDWLTAVEAQVVAAGVGITRWPVLALRLRALAAGKGTKAEILTALEAEAAYYDAQDASGAVCLPVAE